MRRRTTNRLTASRQPLHAIDPLEPRRMLATFNGTSANDTINLSMVAGGTASIVQINGVSNTTTDPTITINAGGGNDAFRVFSMLDDVTIIARGEGGNDTLVNPSTLDLDAVYDGQFTFDGGTGTDEIVADNGNDTTTPYQVNLTSVRINKAQTPGGSTFTVLEYDNVESLQYWDSNGSNVIGFHEMHSFFGDNVELEIHGNAGNDTIINTSDVTSAFGNWDESIGTGGALIDGGTGTDALQLSNGADDDTNLYQFTGTSIHGFAFPGSGTGSLTYSAVEAIDFIGGAHGENLVISSKPSATALHVNGGAGSDNFTVGGNDLDSSGLLLSNTTFIGGPGTDSIITDDLADTSADGVSNYTWNATTLAKGTAGFNFSEFESQRLIVSNGTIAGLNSVPRVDLNQTSSAITSTTIVGGNARMCRVDVGAGNLNNINGALTVDLEGGTFDSLNILNSVPNVNAVYHLNQGSVSGPRDIDYVGVRTLTINAGPGNDSFFIDGLSSGTAANLVANDGDDFFTLGAGDVGGTVLGPVTMNGGTGLNTGTVNNATDNSPATQALSGGTFTDGQSHTFNSLNRLLINGGPGGSNLAVNATAFPTDINGNSGNDTYTVGGGDLDANLLGGSTLMIEGQGGNDRIVLNDLNDTNLDEFYNFRRLILGIDQFFIDGVIDRFVQWRDVEGVTLEASNAEASGSGNSACFIVVIDSGTPLTINGNGGPDSIQVLDAAFPVIVHTGPGQGDSIFLNADLDNIPGSAILQQSDEVQSLGISSGGMLRITSGAVLSKTGTLAGNLTIDGVLDLAGGALLSRASGTTLDFFRTRLGRGRNGGGWNGSGAGGAINSSTAAASPSNDGVGYGAGSQIAINSIGGFSIGADDVLVRHTLDGDADLSGAVNLADFNRLAANFGQSNRAWTDGDSDYDGTVNLTDFNALAGNFGTSASPATLFAFNPGGALGDRDDTRPGLAD